MVKAKKVATKPQKIFDTPYGRLDLSKSADLQHARKVVIDLQRQTDAITERDIADWKSARQMAVNYEDPSRQKLYDIYSDVDIDSHLSGAVGQINGMVKARSFKLTNIASSEQDDKATELLNSTWFKDLIDYILQARYWGHSLIELGTPVVGSDGRRMYDHVTLMPRKHVVPEKGRITRVPGDDWRTGIDYRQAPYADWLIEAGKPDELGLYLKAALHTIPKKNMAAFWDQFGEIFGMPMRIARTTSRDPKERRKIEYALEHMGSAMWGLFGEGTEIDLKESTRGDAYNVYDKRIMRCDSELSKLILLQTMTIDDGSSLSQSETHLDVLKNLVEEIADKLRDVINDQLLPRMIKHGFPVNGLRFDWDYEEDYTPEQMANIEALVVNNYELPGSYFEEKYGIPAGKRREGITLRKPDSGFFD